MLVYFPLLTYRRCCCYVAADILPGIIRAVAGIADVPEPRSLICCWHGIPASPGVLLGDSVLAVADVPAVANMLFLPVIADEPAIAVAN